MRRVVVGTAQRAFLKGGSVVTIALNQSRNWGTTWIFHSNLADIPANSRLKRLPSLELKSDEVTALGGAECR
jgi:hypothetical protein